MSPTSQTSLPPHSRVSEDGDTTAMSSSDDSTSNAGSCSPLSLLSAETKDVITVKTASSLKDFEVVRRIGSGDIGNVYLCRLRSDDEAVVTYYAMKVVDKEALEAKKKTRRAEMERKILKLLDHPFLPTLYAEFEAARFSCVVMEFCPGGDLLSLRDRQPFKRFDIAAARFYAAEVLVALEYLHMLGIIYRDLKPENVLVRSDGHIMLTDFDLSMCSHSIPTVQPSPLQTVSKPFKSETQTRSNRSNRFPCLPLRFFLSKKIETLNTNHLFVAEPVSARSCSFVGTHEYVSPEVAAGGSHGNAVDWWSLGIFIYELIYGRTPFVGETNDVTLRNILKKPLTFPTYVPCCMLEAHAQDLISRLLVKDPARRLGSTRGAADVRIHPFFKGLNFALVRSMRPPVVPGSSRQRSATATKGEDSMFSYF
ncbi:kinase PINOID-like protein [Drosera capensis]